MSDAVSFTEIDGQHVELLPARTVMSTVFVRGGGNGGQGGPGGKGTGGIAALDNVVNVNVLGDQSNSAANGIGGGGGSANGGHA